MTADAIEVIPGAVLHRPRWVQSCGLDPEPISCRIMDELDGLWGLHRGGRGYVQFDRLTARFGLEGVTSTLGGRKQRVDPMPPVLRALARGLSLLLGGDELNFVYCNLYADGGAGIRKHCDRGFLELAPITTIASLSFGQPRLFQLWRQSDLGLEAAVLLGPGDLCVMRGDCQLRYLHSIPKERDADGPRLSLTFRNHRPVPEEVIKRAVRSGRRRLGNGTKG